MDERCAGVNTAAPYMDTDGKTAEKFQQQHHTKEICFCENPDAGYFSPFFKQRKDFR